MALMRDIGEQILNLHSQGRSYTQIAKELGCSKGTISYHCGKGQKTRHLERQRDRRSKIRKFIQEYKTGKPCTDCKEVYPYWMMEFDHLKDKKFNISTAAISGLTLEELKQEIDKCELVCSNCHRNRTHWRLVKSGADTLEFDLE
jgi:predicted transcriptional regulator